MRTYRTAMGALVATQAEAGKGWERLEIPDDKAGLLAFINAERGRGTAPALPLIDAPAPAAEPAPAPAASAERCPACARTPKAAAAIALGMETDAIAERILESDGWALAKLLGACVERFTELRAAAQRLA